jgi:hypothetical protein
MMLVVICIDLERWRAVIVAISWIQSSGSKFTVSRWGAIKFQSLAELAEGACIKKRRHDGSLISRFTRQTRKRTREAEARECRRPFAMSLSLSCKRSFEYLLPGWSPSGDQLRDTFSCSRSLVSAVQPGPLASFHWPPSQQSISILPAR